MNEYNNFINKNDFWVNLRKKDPRMKKFIDAVIDEKLPIVFRKKNYILKTDSYKATQFNMFMDDEFDDNDKKERLIYMNAFVEPRKGARDSHVIVAGIDAIQKELSSIVITMGDIYEAIYFFTAHFSTPVHDGRYHFNPLPWLKVVLEHDGKLPLLFKGLPEGTIVPVGIPIATLESEDEDCAQLVSHFEGLVQKAIWYPTTVATNALGYSKAIKAALMKTASVETMNRWLPFSLHDFGYRGAASEEAACIGGGAALYVTMGSDTVPAVKYLMDSYGSEGIELACLDMPGYSVAACEHNQMMSKGRDGEFMMVKRLLKNFPTGILSVVADTYDVVNHVKTITTGTIRDMIMARNGTYVIRPDSQILKDDGTEMTPAETISTIFAILDRNLKDYISVNERGFKVLPPTYKVIYGDGLNIPKITSILDHMVADGWCASNIIFGVGGNLLQRIDRDTERFAMKASQQIFEIVDRDGNVTRETRNVCKETPGKESKKGRFHVGVMDEVIQWHSIDSPSVEGIPNLLSMVRPNTLKEIRERVNYWRDKLGF